jgi:hypothetical protein
LPEIAPAGSELLADSEVLGELLTRGVRPGLLPEALGA